MMKIRNEQIDEIQQERERAFIEEIIDALQENHPKAVEGIRRNTLREMVGNGIERARGHRLTKKYAIGLFIELMFLVAPNFDEYPPIQITLKDRTVDPDERMNRLADSITERQWQGAKARSDSAAWGLASGGPNHG